MNDENDPNIKSDYEYSRATYYELIDKGRESLDLMIEVARESEHPRAFEVLSNMIKNISDVNDKLMELNKKNKDITQTQKNSEQRSLTQNNMFVGSTADLQRMILNQNDEKEVIDVDSKNE